MIKCFINLDNIKQWGEYNIRLKRENDFVKNMKIFNNKKGSSTKGDDEFKNKI